MGALKSLFPHSRRATLMRMTSHDAAAVIQNESLDFVWIDGAHDYEEVSEDLAIWFPKLRSGGILAGHDYFLAGMLDVNRAVHEFFSRHPASDGTLHVAPYSFFWQKSYN